MISVMLNDLILMGIMTADTFPQLIPGYLGPGAAISTIGTFLVILLAIVVSVVGFVWYPVKRMMGKKKLQEPDAVPEQQE